MSTRNTIVVDWDGTLQTDAWPSWGEWQKGAVKAMHRLHNAGLHLMVASARLSPYEYHEWPARIERDQFDYAHDINMVRERLDAAGLPFVEIWTDRGKPPGGTYIDDNAVWYPGRPGSWDAVATKVLMKYGKEDDEC